MQTKIIVAIIVVIVIVVAVAMWINRHKKNSPYPPMLSYGPQQAATDYPGNDFSPAGVGPVSDAQCQMICSVLPGCQGYVYGAAAQVCYPKSVMKTSAPKGSVYAVPVAAQ